MSTARLPAVRLPAVVAGQEIDEQDMGEGSVVVELPPSNKFGFAWPAETTLPMPLTLAADRPAGTSLSSSEGETDVSEEEPCHPVRRGSRAGESDDSEFVTPTNNLDADQNPLDQGEHLPQLPRLSRAFSMPLPSQLGSLQNPRRVAFSPLSDHAQPVIEFPSEYGHFHELSLELADSVQMVIQTLLQLSPPQVLDPAKEQFSACSLSIPTPSISAMFTSMKNLNYMSANMSALSLDPPAQQSTDNTEVSTIQATHTDFDVGEMLQSVGDALSGLAAQAGVDLVLFHGNLGMKHIGVRGDESGISYTLSHVIRQVIGTAQPGDTIEVGLFIEPALARQDGAESIPSPGPDGLASPRDFDGPLRCMFHVAHKFADPMGRPNAYDNGSVPASPFTPSFRPLPSFKTLFLRRLLKHVDASLDVDVPPKGLSSGRLCELAVTLGRGSPSVVDPTVSPDDAFFGNPELKISHEPTLEQLTQFAETLKGRKVTLFANSKGAFAQHLTSYLTAWGLDVSHLSTEPNADGSPEQAEATLSNSVQNDLVPGFQEQVSGSILVTPGLVPADPLSFCLIDDDVAVLRQRLKKIREDLAYPLNLTARKRPSLAANHRPRSSPQVARVMGLTPTPAPFSPAPVLIHFTSLSNYKLVKDAIQSALAVPSFGNSMKLPEIIVIPKPAGPRRVLTALHTAITKPVVDPFFYPTATSPISPGFHPMTPFFNISGAAKSPGGRSTTSVRTSSDKSAKSPKDYAPSSPRGVSDSMEYFSDAATKLGASPASGLVIQSPDGQPAGIFFHPKQKGTRSNLPTPAVERGPPYHETTTRNRGVSFRRTPDQSAKGGALEVSTADLARRSPHPPTSANVESFADAPSTDSAPNKGKKRVPTAPPPSESVLSTFGTESPIVAGLAGSPTSEQTPTATTVHRTASRKGGHGPYNENLMRHASDPPTSPSRTTTAGPARRIKRPTVDNNPASALITTQKKGKQSESHIVPPISVLIVDDNPINQTILSTFMKKKKIKFDVAMNGEEAVQKWQTGGFHLILMDIQMPVMNGIDATKEIRRMEKIYATGGFPSTPQSEGQRTPSEASTTGSRSATSTPPYRSSVIIVALTASSLQSDRVAALAAGCNDFLTKPVSLQWLNSKIIEWGSIKALQMWADIRPDVVRNFSTGQTAQAQRVAHRLRVPEGRSSPMSGSRSSSVAPKSKQAEQKAARSLSGGDKTVTPNTPVLDDSPGESSGGSPEPAPLSSTPVPAAIEHIAGTEVSAANTDAAGAEESAGEAATQDRPDSAGDVPERFATSTSGSGLTESPQRLLVPLSERSDHPVTAQEPGSEFDSKDSTAAETEGASAGAGVGEGPPPDPQ